MCTLHVCAHANTHMHVHAYNFHMQIGRYAVCPYAFTLMNSCKRRLPLQHSCSNLILRCASKSDISGKIVCMCNVHTGFVVDCPDESADSGLRYLPGRQQGHFSGSERVYLEDDFTFCFPSMINLFFSFIRHIGLTQSQMFKGTTQDESVTQRKALIPAIPPISK